jgi:serine/threonine protein kinase/CheY-like chemotaxis protein
MAGELKQAVGRRSTGARVLLVDDDGRLRRALRRTLAAAGHAVVEAGSAAEAIQLFDAQDFDLVLTDVQMPDMDGVELLKRVRERKGDQPVLLISGDPDLKSALKAVEYGALEYLTKPVQRAKFLASVERALILGRRRRQDHSSEARSGERRRPQRNELTGALLAGRYRVGALLGSGGMGSVYEAVREDLGQMPVAIKVLHESIASDEDALGRFRREAHTVARLNHQNIVRILDFQMPGDEPAFLVMERLTGCSLGDALKHGRRFSIQEVAIIAAQALDALAVAHAADVVHRDLKPDNVFLVASAGAASTVKLLDFGVAKLTGTAPNEKLTQTGAILGTPAYMSPEQARGAEVDLRTDLYALGCVMFEALRGEPPVVADNYNALIFKIQVGRATPLGASMPNVDTSFIALIDRAIARDPADRFQSAQQMAEALRPWTAPRSVLELRIPDSSPLALATTLSPPESRPTRKRKRSHTKK